MDESIVVIFDLDFELIAPANRLIRVHGAPTRQAINRLRYS